MSTPEKNHCSAPCAADRAPPPVFGFFFFFAFFFFLFEVVFSFSFFCLGGFVIGMF